MTYEAVFFDFDGVIADSVDVKTDAFAGMFDKYGNEIKQKVVEHHLKNGGVSRYDKFRYYYNNFLKKSIDESEVQKLSKKFSELVVNKVIESKYIPGAIETLKLLYTRSIPAYVVSGTPHDEINVIIDKKKIKKYFIEVHGSPEKKSDIVLDIIRRKSYNPIQCIFLGDALSDFNAAVKTGMPFMGIVKEGCESVFPPGTAVSERIELTV